VGLLSLGFVAAAGLTMLALLLYSLFSFRRRMVEIGVLRAAGLSLLQLGWLLTFELCFLAISSAIAGTALGVAAARLFVPFYQLGTTVEARTPPFIVVIAWAEIGRLLVILGGMLLITLLATMLLLRRLRIHEAIKLGQELG
jgi:putative ABC transport system permease protein